MGLFHILTYVFVFTLGGAAVDLVRIAVKAAARRRSCRVCTDTGRLRLDAERAPYLEAGRREVDEMFWETSSLGRPEKNEAAVPEPRGYGPIEISFVERRAVERAAQAPGPVIINGHTLPAVDDERWTKYSSRSCSFPGSLSVWDDGEARINGKTWFTHKAVKTYYKQIDDRLRPIQDAKDKAALAAAIADVEAASRKRP